MRAFVAVLACLLLIAPQRLAAAPAAKQVDLHWSELQGYIVRGCVTVVQKDGTVVKGKAIAAGPDALVLQTSRGRAVIPRNDLRALSLTETRGAAWRVLLTLTAVIVTLVTLGYVAAEADPGGDNHGLAAGFLGGVTAAGFGGYYAGRALDRKTTIIRILPD